MIWIEPKIYLKPPIEVIEKLKSIEKHWFQFSTQLTVWRQTAIPKIMKNAIMFCKIYATFIKCTLTNIFHR